MEISNKITVPLAIIIGFIILGFMLDGDNAPERVSTPTTSPSTTSNFILPSCASTDCDCGDFSTHAYAQWFYENYNPGDKHRLDGNDDGVACESLP